MERAGNILSDLRRSNLPPTRGAAGRARVAPAAPLPHRPGGAALLLVNHVLISGVVYSLLAPFLPAQTHCTHSAAVWRLSRQPAYLCSRRRKLPHNRLPLNPGWWPLPRARPWWAAAGGRRWWTLTCRQGSMELPVGCFLVVEQVGCSLACCWMALRPWAMDRGVDGCIGRYTTACSM